MSTALLNIAEIVGPSGIGKSAIYSDVSKAWRSSSSWAPFEVLLSELSGNESSMLSKVKAFERKLRRSPQPSRLAEAEIRFAAAYPEFTSFVWDLVTRYCGNADVLQDRRFTAIHWFMSFFRKEMAIRETNAEAIALLDEGLVSAFMQFGGNVATPDVEKYVKLVPPPKSIIHLRAEPSVIAQRAVARARQSSLHKGMTTAAIENISINTARQLAEVVSGLKQRGVGVFEVDASGDVHTTAEKVRKVLNRLP